jgi:uroporphyrinogen-III synthase
MCINKPVILITAEVEGSLIQQMKSTGFIVDIIPFIHTEITGTRKIQEQIEHVLQLDAAVVFTSNNAVEAVSASIQNKKPNWKVYCIGNTTKTLIEQLFGEASIAAIANDATSLSEKIVADKTISEIFFFCGDKRRNELPALLKENSISVNEIEVYTTTILQHAIEKDYDGILFFSPSAVDGFFETNKVNEKTILFAIGNTTANELKKFSQNIIVVSDKPGKQNLIEKAVSFFEDL